MNQNVTLFSDKFDSISKSQLLQAFETLETCATDFFGKNRVFILMLNTLSGTQLHFLLKSSKQIFQIATHFLRSPVFVILK